MAGICYGAIEIYKGKSTNNGKTTTKGIVALIGSVFSASIVNPIFDSNFLSLLTSVGFTGLITAFASYGFLNTKPTEITEVTATVENIEELEQKTSLPSVDFMKVKTPAEIRRKE